MMISRSSTEHRVIVDHLKPSHKIEIEIEIGRHGIVERTNKLELSNHPVCPNGVD